VDAQQATIVALRAENQALRDEVARLKGLPPRPPSRPSGMEQATQPGAAGRDEKGRWQGFRPRVHTGAVAPWRDDRTSGGNSNGSPAPGAGALCGGGRWREKVPDEASAHRFVPEAMRGGDTGTLIAQQPCGTVQGRRTAPSHPAPQLCRKGWFAGRLRRTPETAAALGSPSYKQPPVTATPV